jgi:hypothetical protein
VLFTIRRWKTLHLNGQKNVDHNAGFADALIFAQVDGDKFTGLVDRGLETYHLEKRKRN